MSSRDDGYAAMFMPELESEGALHALAYTWAKANMPYFADAVDV